MAVRLEVWGDYALFSRPEMKTERVSYDVLTPSAARGILEAIMWHPPITASNLQLISQRTPLSATLYFNRPFSPAIFLQYFTEFNRRSLLR